MDDLPRAHRPIRCALIALALAVSIAPATASAAEIMGGWTKPFEGRILGSRQYAIGVVEAGLGVAMLPGGDIVTGVHYVERGSLLAQMIANATQSAGAGVRAAQTGKDQTYMVDRSPKSNAALRLDYFKNGSSYLLNADLFWSIPLMEDDPLPLVLDVGLGVKQMRGNLQVEIEDDNGKKTTPNELQAAEFFFGMVIPASKWVTIQARAAFSSLKPYYTVELGGLANLGNRYFASFTWQRMVANTFGLNMGIRL